MRDCYDSLLAAAAATTNSAYGIDSFFSFTLCDFVFEGASFKVS